MHGVDTGWRPCSTGRAWRAAAGGGGVVTGNGRPADLLTYAPVTAESRNAGESEDRRFASKSRDPVARPYPAGEDAVKPACLGDRCERAQSIGRLCGRGPGRFTKSFYYGRSTMRQATRVDGVLMGAVFALMMVVAGESAGGVPDGITGHDGDTARLVEGGMAPQGAAQREITGARAVGAGIPMSPVSPCGQSAQSTPALLAQAYWGVCRKGREWCYLAHPHYRGQKCCCHWSDGEVDFCGRAQPL